LLIKFIAIRLAKTPTNKIARGRLYGLMSFVGDQDVQLSSKTISANPILKIASHRQITAYEIANRRRAVSPIFNGAKIVASRTRRIVAVARYCVHDTWTYIYVPYDRIRGANFKTSRIEACN